jgi:hypothetical protein
MTIYKFLCTCLFKCKAINKPGCLESFTQGSVNYLDEISLAYMAVSGDDFITSGWNGFMCNL